MGAKGGATEAVEYRDAEKGYLVRMVLRVRAGDPPTPEAGEVRGLGCARPDAAVYQVTFRRGGRRFCHEYPLASVARCEEEWAPVPDCGH